MWVTPCPTRAWKVRAMRISHSTVAFAALVATVACSTGDRPESTSSASSAICSAEVLTQGYGPERTNSQGCETTLTPANVNAAQFGKLYSRYVDGRVYAQPLYVED